MKVDNTTFFVLLYVPKHEEYDMRKKTIQQTNVQLDHHYGNNSFMVLTYTNTCLCLFVFFILCRFAPC